MKRKGGPATARQRAFLEAIADLSLELGRAPSAVEIAKRVGVTRTGARPQLRALEAKGLLVDVPKQVSSGKWKLSPAALAVLAEADLEKGFDE